MKYEIFKAMDDENNFFHVIYETATEQIIDYFFFEDEAQSYNNFLNNGGAFDGFTPNFMLKELVFTSQEYNVNKKFNDFIDK